MDKSFKFSFLVFALFAIVFGFIKISQTIRLTFSEGEGEKSNQEIAQPELDDLKLRVIDTDSDGLYDWDEINVYGTSPYLSDTDSDGISDSEELKLGTDPNCAKGKACGSDIINLLEDFNAKQKSGKDSSKDSLPVGQDISQNAKAVLDALQKGGTPTPDQIRGLLREQGISEDQLSGATDEEIMQMFEEAFASSKISE